MLNRRLTLWAAILLVAILVLSGCAPRAGAGVAETADPMELVVDLPALVVDIQADGSASVGNVPVAQLGQMAGADLSTLGVPGEWVDFMVSGNIQHLQVNNHSEGLMLLVNGEPVPSISYDGNALSATADALSTFGVAIPMADKVLGLVDQIGLGVIVRFPVAAGVAQIPLFVEGDGSAAMAARQAQEEFLAAVGNPPHINLPVFYDADGSWSVGNLSDSEWSALTGAPFSALRLNSSMMDQIAAAGVDELSISTDAEGIHIGINGQELPTLTWADGELLHLLTLADQANLLDMVSVPNLNMGDVLATVNELLPVVTATDFDLTVHFPASGMATR